MERLGSSTFYLRRRHKKKKKKKNASVIFASVDVGYKCLCLCAYVARNYIRTGQKYARNILISENFVEIILQILFCHDFVPSV